MGIMQGEAEVMRQEMGEGEWCPWGLMSGAESSLECWEVTQSSSRALTECGWMRLTDVMEELAGVLFWSLPLSRWDRDQRHQLRLSLERKQRRFTLKEGVKWGLGERFLLGKCSWMAGQHPPPPRTEKLRGCGFRVGRVSRVVCFPLIIFSCQVHVENRWRVGLNQQA